jgi:hypothetical protein
MHVGCLSSGIIDSLSHSESVVTFAAVICIRLVAIGLWSKILHPGGLGDLSFATPPTIPVCATIPASACGPCFDHSMAISCNLELLQRLLVNISFNLSLFPLATNRSSERTQILLAPLPYALTRWSCLLCCWENVLLRIRIDSSPPRYAAWSKRATWAAQHTFR